MRTLLPSLVAALLAFGSFEVRGQSTGFHRGQGQEAVSPLDTSAAYEQANPQRAQAERARALEQAHIQDEQRRRWVETQVRERRNAEDAARVDEQRRQEQAIRERLDEQRRQLLADQQRLDEQRRQDLLQQQRIAEEQRVRQESDDRWREELRHREQLDEQRRQNEELRRIEDERRRRENERR